MYQIYLCRSVYREYMVKIRNGGTLFDTNMNQILKKLKLLTLHSPVYKRFNIVIYLYLLFNYTGIRKPSDQKTKPASRKIYHYYLAFIASRKIEWRCLSYSTQKICIDVGWGCSKRLGCFLTVDYFGTIMG